MKYGAFALWALLAGLSAAAQAQTIEYYEPYNAPILPVTAPSINVPSINVPPLYAPPLHTPPLFVPPLQNSRRQLYHPFRRGTGGAYAGYDTVGSGGIGYESPGAYPRDRRFADRTSDRVHSTRGFNPGAGDPTFNPSGIKSAGFGHRR